MAVLIPKTFPTVGDCEKGAEEASHILHHRQLTIVTYNGLLQLKKERANRAQYLNPLIFFISLSISLLLVIVGINWKTYDRPELIDLGIVAGDFDQLIDVPLSEQPPPPPPQKNLVSPQIIEVPDEVILEEIDFELDLEITEDTKVADVIINYDAEPIEEEKVEEIFLIVEELPVPQGGMSSFYQYVSDNIKYPDQARRMEISGMVFLQFVVEKDGDLTDVKVVKGIGAGCDAEAKRVLESAPSWKPGKQRGRPVRVYMTVPIRFVLAGVN
jgi:protein TonB